LPGVLTLSLTTACATTPQIVETSPPPKPDYVVPALEIVAFDAALQAFDRAVLNDSGAFSVTRASIRRNLRATWVVDDDVYEINQIGHPYQGSMYHGFARSAGLNYWASSAYTFAGSLLWEIAGETSRPSINDQIASGIAGSFLGEALFRTANLLIDKSDNRPGFGRMLLVLFVSPPTAANRALFGGRFDRVVPTRDPMYDARIQAGASRDETMVDLSIDYGLPGTPTYEFRRPFDNFTVHAILSSTSLLESLMTRGLLAGQDYARGQALRGVWGLYGSYDYLSPELFRVSTTALSVGTSVHSWLSDRVALQGSALGGVGYAAAQVLPNSTSGREYHYGVAPQGSVSMRLVAADRVALDVSAREYYVSSIGGLDGNGRDTITRADASIGVRVHKRSAITVRYLVTSRSVSGPAAPNSGPAQTLSRRSLAVFYTLLGPGHFGAVDWRK
jgi:hypothetical protein